jgi:hypothetical protein
MVKSALATLAVLIGIGTSQALAKGSPVYTVAKVTVEAEAKDAVEAKQIAINEGQQAALRALLMRLTPPAAHQRLPILEDQMVERMIDGFSVRRESNSTTRYIATLDFSFEPGQVRNVLNQFGLPYAEEQAPPVVLLPVMTEAGGVRTGSENAWFEALEGVDTEHALAAIRLTAPRADFAPGSIANPGSPEVLQTLRQQYRTDALILALAEVDAQRSKLKLRLIGQDSVGNFYLQRAYTITGRDVDEAARFAAKITVGIIEGRWKTTRLASLGAVDAAALANLENVALSVQFSGLKQWQGIRQRLERIPGLQGLDVQSLNARGATISVEFSGGAERLAQAVQSQGLAIMQQGGRLVLMAR